MGFSKVIKDCATGADNETYAVGRLYSLPLLLAGVAIPFVLLSRGEHLDLAQLGLYFAGVGGAVTAVIRGTQATEPPPSTGAAE